MQTTPPNRKCHVSDRQPRPRITPASCVTSNAESPPGLVPVSHQKHPLRAVRNKKYLDDFAKTAALFNHELQCGSSLIHNISEETHVVDSLNLDLIDYPEIVHSKKRRRVFVYPEDLLKDYYNLMFEWMCSFEDSTEHTLRTSTRLSLI